MSGSHSRLAARQGQAFVEQSPEHWHPRNREVHPLPPALDAHAQNFSQKLDWRMQVQVSGEQPPTQLQGE
jgi:hypothetical protein